jgi:hypothetical protein
MGEFRVSEKDPENRALEQQQISQLRQRIQDPRYAGTPGFGEKTIRFRVGTTSVLNGITPYVKRTIEVVAATNEAFTRDRRVLEKAAEEQKKAELKAKRIEAAKNALIQVERAFLLNNQETTQEVNALMKITKAPKQTDLISSRDSSKYLGISESELLASNLARFTVRGKIHYAISDITARLRELKNQPTTPIKQARSASGKRRIDLSESGVKVRG